MKKVLSRLLNERGINPGAYLYHITGQEDAGICWMCAVEFEPRLLCRVGGSLVCAGCAPLWLLGMATKGHGHYCECHPCGAWWILADPTPVKQLA